MASASWVEDTSFAQGATDISRISAIGIGKGTGTKNSKISTRKEKLEAELKLLEWHKMANDAALKAALMQSRTIKDSSPTKAASTKSFVTDDEKWIRQVIDEEQVKPLEVSRAYVLDYEKREKENAEKLSGQVERHINTLKKLRERLEKQQDVKSRSEEYRQWQKSFAPKKHAVLSGKTLDEVHAELSRLSGGDRGGTGSMKSAQGTGMNTASSKQANNAQDLSAVLDSLNKLAELESRITNLENDNQYDYLLAKEKGVKPAHAANADFKRKRVPLGPGVAAKASQGPLGVKYTVQPKPAGYQMSGQRSSGMGGVGRGSGVQAARASRNAVKASAGPSRFSTYGSRNARNGGGGAGGTFLTGGDYGNDEEMDVEEAREVLKRERRRQMATMSEGQKSLKSRLTSKKSRLHEQVAGARRHEEALREMAKRKSNVSMGTAVTGTTGGVGGRTGGAGGRMGANSRVQLPARGAASGLKTKNKYLADFEKIKAGFAKKKGTKFVPGPNDSRLGASNNNNNNNRRQPTLQPGGTVTRRSVVPLARNKRGVDTTAPVGVAGIREMRSRRQMA